MKEYKETHAKGFMTIENECKGGYVDIGIQISSDGRVWVCIDGIAFIRFKLMSTEEWLKLSKTRVAEFKNGIQTTTLKVIDEPCNNFEEDPYITHDFGEPKGQCIRCGWSEKDHSNKEI